MILKVVMAVFPRNDIFFGTPCSQGVNDYHIRKAVLVFPRSCGRVAMGVVFVESDVGPGWHLAGRHQLLLDVPAGDTRLDRSLNLPGVRIFADKDTRIQVVPFSKCYLFIAVSMSKSRSG